MCSAYLLGAHEALLRLLVLRVQTILFGDGDFALTNNNALRSAAGSTSDRSRVYLLFERSDVVEDLLELRLLLYTTKTRR